MLDALYCGRHEFVRGGIMRRPLTLVGLCCLFTLAAAVRFGQRISFLLFWLCVLAFSISLFYRRTREARVFPTAFLTMAAAFLCFSLYSRFFVQPPRALDGKDINITGTVCELPYRQNGRWYYVVKVDAAQKKNTPKNFKVRLSSQSALTEEPYSRISGKVHFFMPGGGDGYSSRSYYASKGIMMFAYLYEYENVKVSPPTYKPPYYYALKLRRALLDSAGTMLPPDEAKILKGVLLGDKTSLDSQTTADFRTAGISHLLAVSGLHMATVVQLIVLLLALLNMPKRFSAVVSCIGVLVFMSVTCFVPSVTRSGIMCLLYVSAPLISRRADPLNSLGTAVLIICAANPYAAADVGLLLSFSAVLGLILFAGKFQNYFNAKWDKIKFISPLVRGLNGILATSLAAMLFTLPVIILSFGTVSVVAPLSNILEIVPSSIMIMFGAAAVVINLFAPHSILVLPFAIVTGLLAKYMRCCASMLAKIPFASVPASSGFVTLWISSVLILCAVSVIICGGKRLLKAAAWLSVIVLLTGIFSYQLVSRNVTRVAVLDVGTAESVVITRNGHAAVVGCGGYNSNAIINYLNSQNHFGLDYVETLTTDREENVNLCDLAARFTAKNLIVSSGDMYDGFINKAVSLAKKTCAYNTTAFSRLWDSVEIKTVQAGDVRAAFIETGGVSILVCPGGADASALPEYMLKADFVVTDTGAGFMDKADPVCTIISADKDDLTKNIGKFSGLNCVKTGGYGNVVLEISGGGKLSVRRENNA